MDVKGKSLGRAASEAAVILRGKTSADFAPNRAPKLKLAVENIDDIKITGNKLKQKEYARHSGYPGSLKFTKLEDAIAKKGIKYVFERAVEGMLPKNRLRNEMMKNLSFR